MKWIYKALIWFYVLIQIVYIVRYFLDKSLMIQEILFPTTLLISTIMLIWIVKGIKKLLKYLEDI